MKFIIPILFLFISSFSFTQRGSIKIKKKEVEKIEEVMQSGWMLYCYSSIITDIRKKPINYGFEVNCLGFGYFSNNRELNKNYITINPHFRYLVGDTNRIQHGIGYSIKLNKTLNGKLSIPFQFSHDFKLRGNHLNQLKRRINISTGISITHGKNKHISFEANINYTKELLEFGTESFFYPSIAMNYLLPFK